MGFFRMRRFCRRLFATFYCLLCSTTWLSSFILRPRSFFVFSDLRIQVMTQRFRHSNQPDELTSSDFFRRGWSTASRRDFYFKVLWVGCAEYIGQFSCILDMNSV